MSETNAEKFSENPEDLLVPNLVIEKDNKIYRINMSNEPMIVVQEEPKLRCITKWLLWVGLLIIIALVYMYWAGLFCPKKYDYNRLSMFE